MKIRRRCKCGCGKITKPGNKYIFGHHLFGNTNAKGNKISEGHKKKISVAQKGNAHGKGNKGYKQSEEHILKRSIPLIKYDPDYEYCGAWQDIKYKKDLRKDYCENVDCKNNYNQLQNHHIDLNKKNCHPLNIMTLCASCHAILHHKIGFDGIPKDFMVINRSDHISYINKKTRNKIIMLRR